jgi:predicted nuclease of predicted toxin-antitoxin system
VSVRLLADASLRASIVRGVIRAAPSIDFLAANLAQLESVPDDEVLAIAARAGRILVTHDLKTMPSHFGTFLSHSQSPGVFLISQRTSIVNAIEARL